MGKLVICHGIDKNGGGEIFCYFF